MELVVFTVYGSHSIIVMRLGLSMESGVLRLGRPQPPT
jgi:hypothetical protein